MPLADRQEIQGLLDGMRRQATAGARVDAVRHLLAQLNYDPTPRRVLALQLPKEVEGQLAAAPGVIATGGADGGFLVIHTQLAGETLSRLTERAVVTALLKDHPYALFVFGNADHSRWHFLNVKVARKAASDENRDAKLRRLYRRISVAPEDRLRTATERIEKLDLAAINPDLFGLSPLAIQERHDDAFDVEAVTRQFFQEYRRVFEIVEGALTGIRGADKRRLFTQRLFNRLMFIAFIEKKGWLKFPGMGDNEYLEALWRDYQAKRKDKSSNFYDDRLEHLFFQALNSPVDVNVAAKLAQRAKIIPAIGDVPYLNGGLFERSPDGTDDRDAGITVPDKAIDAVLHELFARFNFTVTESTPLDVEVAVDPEMLGKVFEELVTGRHESGSYYTPKPIVSFMCREALKGYLETKCPKEQPEAIAQFVDEHDASSIRDGEAVLDALKAVRCCDPACGSGAYLLGMLHELLDLRQTLFKTDRKLDPVSVYQRKLEIIQGNVYGVDLDEFAVNIARLRLWLSLAVDFEGAAPPPLPNLDFKIEAGDSLAAPDPSDSGQLQLQKPLVDQFLELKREYLLAHSTPKKELKRLIDQKREKIKAWTHTSGALPVNAFDWQVEFAEVFVGGGFDVVLANPPYVRMELIKPMKPVLRKNFREVHAERADLYCYFYARAIQMLTPGGVLAFISSNKWFRAGYGENLRKFVGENCTVRSITDFGELPVFAAATFPMIFIAQRGQTGHFPVLTQVTTLDPPYPDFRELIRENGVALSPSAVRGGTWQLADSAAASAFDKMKRAGVRLGEYVAGRIYWGVKTGCNEAFFIDGGTRSQLIAACPQSRAVIKKLTVGDNVRRWRTEREDQYLIYMRHGIDVSQLKPVLKHLAGHRERLEARATRQEWYELQQPQARFSPSFDKPKILYPIIAKEPRFTLDADGTYINDKVFALPVDNLFLLGVLNSSTVWNYLRAHCSVLGDANRGGRLELRAIYMEHLPIPFASDGDRQAIGSLTRKCLDARGVGCEQWEKEIDQRVAALYGL